MKYVFGPVPSRRLGRSLGIDPIPLKTCNWNCVYCQLGRTRPLTNTRREYYRRENILSEVQRALAVQPPGSIDWITFVGSGEPTLHIGLGWLVRQVKTITDLPVAVITNGALLGQKELWAGLLLADAVLPTLDAGNAALYHRINRPWPKLTYRHHLLGLQHFRQVYQGQLWIEIMLLRGINDTEKSLVEISKALELIHPNQVHLTLPVRPPAEDWVQPSDANGLKLALSILGEKYQVMEPSAHPATFAADNDLQAAILGVITRHPMQSEELCAILHQFEPQLVQQALLLLQASGKAKPVDRYGKQYWCPGTGHYAAGIPG